MSKLTRTERLKLNRLLISKGERICKQCGKQLPLGKFYYAFNAKVGKGYYASRCVDCENGNTVIRKSGVIRMVAPDKSKHNFIDLLPSDIRCLERAGWELERAI